jgi:hypothetical protein
VDEGNVRKSSMNTMNIVDSNLQFASSFAF